MAEIRECRIQVTAAAHQRQGASSRAYQQRCACTDEEFGGHSASIGRRVLGVLRWMSVHRHPDPSTASVRLPDDVVRLVKADRALTRFSCRDPGASGDALPPSDWDLKIPTRAFTEVQGLPAIAARLRPVVASGTGSAQTRCVRFGIRCLLTTIRSGTCIRPATCVAAMNGALAIWSA